MKGVTVGTKESVKKGEDRHVVLQPAASGGTFLAAVFDGHGGTHACSHGVHKLSPALQALGPTEDSTSIEDAFWKADDDLGVARASDGSTATVLLVSPSLDGGLQCLLAWVGDSEGAVADLGAVAAGASSPAVYTTTKHTATDATEEQRLQHTWLIARKLRLEKLLPTDETAPSVAVVQKAAGLSGLTLSDAEAALIGRAIARGHRLDHFKFGQLDPTTDGMTSLLAPRVPGGKNFLTKVPTPIHTPETSTHSGDTFATLDKLTPLRSTPHLDGVSTANTRALGDWDGARALVPHPEVLRFRVPPAGCYRVVLASDGVWDFMTTDEACAKVLCKEPDAQACAERLVGLATARSNAKFNGLKDDVTAVVIELNPSGTPPPLHTAAGGGGGGCCVVS